MLFLLSSSSSSLTLLLLMLENINILSINFISNIFFFFYYISYWWSFSAQRNSYSDLFFFFLTFLELQWVSSECSLREQSDKTAVIPDTSCKDTSLSAPLLRFDNSLERTPTELTESYYIQGLLQERDTG